MTSTHIHTSVIDNDNSAVHGSRDFGYLKFPSGEQQERIGKQEDGHNLRMNKLKLKAKIIATAEVST